MNRRREEEMDRMAYEAKGEFQNTLTQMQQGDSPQAGLLCLHSCLRDTRGLQRVYTFPMRPLLKASQSSHPYLMLLISKLFLVATQNAAHGIPRSCQAE